MKPKKGEEETDRALWEIEIHSSFLAASQSQMELEWMACKTRNLAGPQLQLQGRRGVMYNKINK